MHVVSAGDLPTDSVCSLSDWEREHTEFAALSSNLTTSHLPEF